jgi:hypothetical protein
MNENDESGAGLKAAESSAKCREALRQGYGEVSGRFQHDPIPALADGWTWERLAPTIPFVGDQYGLGPRLLIYASAELIKTAKKDGAPWFQDASLAIDRHRLAWRKGWRADQQVVEPGTRVGIAPYEDGPLLNAAACLWQWRGGPALTAQTLTESIAIANFSKFARTDGHDPTSEGQLRPSWPYVQVDLKVLRPKVVLLARSLPWALMADVVQRAVRLGAVVVAMPQASPRGLLHAEALLDHMGGKPTADDDLPLAPEITLHPEGKPLAPSKPRRHWFDLLRARYRAALGGV